MALILLSVTSRGWGFCLLQVYLLFLINRSAWLETEEDGGCQYVMNEKIIITGSDMENEYNERYDILD